MKLNNYIYLIMVGLFAFFMLISPFIFKTPTYQNLLDKCVYDCSKNGLAGRMVKRSEPASPKPSGKTYECVCS